MNERDVMVQTKYGRQASFAVCPDGSGPFPGVILYMDAPGTREELRNMARRIAKHGYFCLLPDLYYRLGMLRFDIPRRNDAMSVVIRGAMESLSNAAIVEDTAGTASFLDAQAKVKPGRCDPLSATMRSGMSRWMAAYRAPLVLPPATSSWPLARKGIICGPDWTRSKEMPRPSSWR